MSSICETQSVLHFVACPHNSPPVGARLPREGAIKRGDHVVERPRGDHAKVGDAHKRDDNVTDSDTL